MTISAPFLISFLKVAELGSVSRAAQALHVSQPAVSKQLRALEQALGTRLLERSGRGVKLTKEGALVVDYGRQSAALLDDCVRALRELGTDSGGSLLLGAGATTCIFQLPRWLGQLRAERPAADVTVRTGNSSVIEALVLERAVDLGLVTSPASSRALHERVLFREEIVLVVARDFVKPPRELEQLPLILFPESTGFRAYLDQKLGAARLARQVKMETDSVEAIKSFVTSGLGASFLPRSAVAKELSARTLRRVALPGLPPLQRSTRVVRRRGRALNATAMRFLELLERG
jgi:DNA-binding transcriptional LysR family regulator